MRTRFGVLLLLVALGFLCIAGTSVAADSASGTHAAQASNNPQDIGGIGPENPLYGFRIALENFDESFTFNQSERLEKEINHTDLRLSDLQSALADNNTDAINRTLDLYWKKFNQTEDSLGQLAFNDTLNMTAPNGTKTVLGPNDTGLENALDMLNRHQEIFQNLTQKYPDNRGLVRAYNNSLEQGQKFKEKIQERSRFGKDNGNKDHTGTADNSMFVPSDHQDFRNLNQTENGNMTASPDDMRQSDRFGNSTFPQGANQSWKQIGGTANITPHMLDSTNQSAHNQNQRQQENPGMQGGQGQSSDHQVNGNGNSNMADNQENRDNSGAGSSSRNGNTNGNENNNGNSRQFAR